MVIESLSDLEKVTIQLEDNRKAECSIVALFPVEELHGVFIALNPAEETGFGGIDEIHLFSLAPLGENLYELSVIDESVFDYVLDAFNRLMEAPAEEI